jgi:C-terminal processing protease CtpA/Prc
MKNNAVNAKSVNWDTLTKNALLKAGSIHDPNELGPVMRYLYASINDHHGAFFYKDSMFQWQGNQPAVSDSIMYELKKGVRIQTRMFPENVGYLRIPSMPGNSIEDFNASAQALNDSLCSILKQSVKGIILDLRLNGGGAMFPMILGVKQLLPPGFTGSWRTNITENWYLKDNGFYIDTACFAFITPKSNIDLSDIPVVILTSPITGSSAEFLIIAFKGRQNTVLIGSKTAGFETINKGFVINDSAGMNLAIGYGADRNGKIYNHAIEPDILQTGIDLFNDLDRDEKVKAGIHWIKSHGK